MRTYITGILLGGAGIAAAVTLGLVYGIPAYHQSASFALRECPQDARHVQCLSDLLQRTYKEEGVTAAFSLFDHLYAADASFVSVCHDMTHGLGTAGYESYARGEPFVMRDAYTNCGYGFFHGFLEALVGHTGNPADARTFCEQLIDQVSGAESVKAACFHGFGHGVTDGSDPRAWGSEQKIVDPGLALCKKITVGEQELRYCAGGVYNALAYMYHTPKYRIALDAADPLKFCRAQDGPVLQEGCYSNFNVIVSRLYGNDFTKISKLVESISDRAVAIDAMTQFAGYQARVHLSPEGDAALIGQCLDVTDYLKVPCIKGLVGGFMHAAEPGREYERTLIFCSSPTLTGVYGELCAATLAGIVKMQFSPAVYASVCKRISVEYPEACNAVH